ncbi:MAG: M15 family metallopeptidase [Acidimicrobiales bacterium]|nr:M15 family metallopeptidase [Acidimicrobiales bacterium]
MASPPTPTPPVPPLAPPEKRLMAGAGLLIVLVLLVAVVLNTGASDAPQAQTTSTTAPTVGRSRKSAAPPPRRPATPPPGTVTNPSDFDVLVDRQRSLPEGYQPADLVEVPVAFTFNGDSPKRLLRRTAADALTALFAAAEDAGLPLRAVSGFRSESSQRDLHDAYVAEDGEAEADRYSASPGHSEHQTGLAMDVTGFDGACPAEACFASRPEAAWLADHAHEFGFVVRYPAGAETLTGYSYEPWHLRYVGVDLAGELHRDGMTLDEWYGTAQR